MPYDISNKLKIAVEKLKSGNLIYKKGNTIVIFNESNESRLSKCSLSLKLYND